MPWYCLALTQIHLPALANEVIFTCRKSFVSMGSEISCPIVMFEWICHPKILRPVILSIDFTFYTLGKNYNSIWKFGTWSLLVETKPILQHLLAILLSFELHIDFKNVEGSTTEQCLAQAMILRLQWLSVMISCPSLIFLLLCCSYGCWCRNGIENLCYWLMVFMWNIAYLKWGIKPT